MAGIPSRWFFMVALVFLTSFSAAHTSCQESGTVNITDSCHLKSGEYVYESFSVFGTTVTAHGDTSTDSTDSFGGVKIVSDENISIVSGGKIDAIAQGYPPNQGPGHGQAAGSDDEGGGSYGGEGGSGDNGGDGGPIYGSESEAKRLGSGGSEGGGIQTGGPGGGAVWLEAQLAKIEGAVNASGTSGGQEDAGGSGGAIRIVTKDFRGSGTLTATGGYGNDDGSGGGGGGGGGRIALYSCDGSSNSFTTDVSEGGAASGQGPGNPGTVFTGDTLGITSEVNCRPPNNATEPDPGDGVEVNDGSVSLSAKYSDPDGDTGKLKFYNSTDDKIGSCSVDSGNRCSVTWDGYDPGTSEWYVVAEDEHGATNTSEAWSFFYDAPPTAMLESPEDGTTVSSEEVELEVTASDPNGGDLDVFFHDASSNSLIGEDKVASGETASVSWYLPTSGENYEWFVNVSDGDENLTKPLDSWKFYRGVSRQFRSRPEFETDYSTVIGSSSNPSFTVIKVENAADRSKLLNTSLHGADAVFEENDNWYIEYEMEPESDRRFRVKITENETGRHELLVRTRNQDLGLETESVKPVYIRDLEAADVSREVPGIGFYNLALIFSAATLLYYLRL